MLLACRSPHEIFWLLPCTFADFWSLHLCESALHKESFSCNPVHGSLGHDAISLGSLQQILSSAAAWKQAEVRQAWGMSHSAGHARSLFADSDFFGAAMGISESFLSLGWIVGPLVGGYAADVAGFAAPFVLTGSLALLATPVLYFLMPASETPS